MSKIAVRQYLAAIISNVNEEILQSKKQRVTGMNKKRPNYGTMLSTRDSLQM